MRVVYTMCDAPTGLRFLARHDALGWYNDPGGAVIVYEANGSRTTYTRAQVDHARQVYDTNREALADAGFRLGGAP